MHDFQRFRAHTRLQPTFSRFVLAFAHCFVSGRHRTMCCDIDKLCFGASFSGVARSFIHLFSFIRKLSEMCSCVIDTNATQRKKKWFRWLKSSNFYARGCEIFVSSLILTLWCHWLSTEHKTERQKHIDTFLTFFFVLFGLPLLCWFRWQKESRLLLNKMKIMKTFDVNFFPLFLSLILRLRSFIPSIRIISKLWCCFLRVFLVDVDLSRSDTRISVVALFAVPLSHFDDVFSLFLSTVRRPGNLQIRANRTRFRSRANFLVAEKCCQKNIDFRFS